MTLDDLENAVTGLSGEELARFRARFFEFDSASWDSQLEKDVAAGRIDALADEAIRGTRVREDNRVMRPYASSRFWQCYRALPEEEQKLADKCIRLLRENPSVLPRFGTTQLRLPAS